MDFGKIKPLDQSDVLKIAAGEVVSRPASVVKELVENAFDAGADNICVVVNNAGKDLIMVQDDGWGMSELDCKNSVLNHWTSKINCFSDLEQVSSFGFRGEALSSISSVSELSIETCLSGAQEGVRIDFCGQEVVASCRLKSLAQGTSIFVKNLFGKIPARLKFLKQNQTENNQISQVFQALAIANYKTGMTLEFDGRVQFDLPAVANQKERLVQLYEFELGQKLLELKTDNISGFVANPTVTRYSRSQIWIFANGRSIKDVKIANAVIAGYNRMLESGKYPVAFINITVAPGELDFNIHPAKEEVRFENYGTICQKVKAAVGQALNNLGNFQTIDLASSCEGKEGLLQEQWQEQKIYNHKLQVLDLACFDKGLEVTFDKTFEAVFDKVQPAQKLESTDSHESVQVPLGAPLEQKIFRAQSGQSLDLTDSGNLPNIACQEPWQKVAFEDQSREKAQLFQASKLSESFTRGPWQAFETIIIFEQKDHLLLIDQHAAHERILYEKALTRGFLKAKLLCPEVLTFPDRQELNLLLQAKDVFTRCAIEFELFGKNQIALKALPVGLGLNCAKNIFPEFFSQSFSQGIQDQELEEKLKFFLFSQVSCKSAVKAGQRLSLKEMEAIFHDLMICKNNVQCIHGRPTMWRLSKTEIFKHFKRF